MKRFALVFALLGSCAGGAAAQSAPRGYGVLGEGGAVDVGRHFKLDYAAWSGVGEPFHAGKLIGSGRHRDASVKHDGAALAGDAAANRGWGVSLGIERGRWMIRAAHQNRHVAPVAPATPMGNNLDAKNSIVAANVRLGAATAYAAYSISRGWGSSPLFNPDNPYGAAMAATPSTDSRDVLVGLALPCGATTWLASFVRKNDRERADRDADQLAIGATYAVSRRTDFYASYSRISMRGGAANAIVRGAGAAALNLGMRHAF